MKRVRTARQVVNRLKQGESAEVLLDRKGQPKSLIRSVKSDIDANTSVKQRGRFKVIQFHPPDEAA